MHHRDKYKKFRQAKNPGQDWPFWKVVFAGWLIRSPMKILRFFLGFGFFLLLIIFEFIPDETIKNWEAQITHQRSY